LRPELDACGIGFVADARGRASRAIVETALAGLACVRHRGAVAADAKTADGSGVLLPIPPAIFGEGHGVAMLFVRGDDPREAVEAAAAIEEMSIVEWREPPTDDRELGEQALASRPRIVQAVLSAESPDERAAFRLRRRIAATTRGVYVASCSFRTVVYKGLVAADALSRFYVDLADERFAASFVVFHQRFSTNTLPSWERSQPFRMLCHNGEINALAGNVKSTACGRAPCSAPRRWASGPRRCSTP
jgi:glutamate synthase domain-containing protein 1